MERIILWHGDRKRREGGDQTRRGFYLNCCNSGEEIKEFMQLSGEEGDYGYWGRAGGGYHDEGQGREMIRSQ
jgi:hypothetical protein